VGTVKVPATRDAPTNTWGAVSIIDTGSSTSLLSQAGTMRTVAWSPKTGISSRRHL